MKTNSPSSSRLRAVSVLCVHPCQLPLQRELTLAPQQLDLGDDLEDDDPDDDDEVLATPVKVRPSLCSRPSTRESSLTILPQAKKSNKKKKKKKAAAATDSPADTPSSPPPPPPAQADTPSQPSKSSKKKKKSAGKGEVVTAAPADDGMDEIDRALAELAVKGGEAGATATAGPQKRLDPKWVAVKEVRPLRRSSSRSGAS